MQAEVISIGDELTSGQRLDTNSQWISQRLGELGIRALWHTTVADDLPANVDVFRRAIERADLVVSTGGLGPTADDLTRQALADAVGRPLVFHPELLAQIEALFARRGRGMPERNRGQAYLPAGAAAIPNPHGTAPGIDLAVERPNGGTSRVFSLPGVPAELFEMWTHWVAPAIRRLAPAAGAVVHRRIKCFGAGESDIEQMLPDLIRRGRTPQVGITVSDATITLGITASGPDEAACRAAIEPTAQTIYQCLGGLVFGEEDDELQDVVLRQLVACGQTLATIEWGTAGLVADWLGEASATAPAYLGGLVVADRRAVRRLFSPETAVLEPTCRELAERLATGWRETTGADYALAVGAFPEPAPPEAPPSQVCLALASAAGVESRQAPYAGQPAFLRRRTAKQGLNLVRRTLMGLG